MPSFGRWLRSKFQRSVRDDLPEVLQDQDPVPEMLEQARALVGAGVLHEAARAYSEIPRASQTTEILLEYAELLVEIGDYFRAASTATRVLEVEPTNPRALAIRKAVLRGS